MSGHAAGAVQDSPDTLVVLRDRLVQELGSASHWTGHLSSSALATAVACFALARVDRRGSQDLIRRGLEWIAAHRNQDGGWGDSPRSPSNLTATLLVWSALKAREPRWSFLHDADHAAAQWLTRRLGGLSPARIVEGIDRRYQSDRTFAAPILALCALAGRLGDQAAAWSRVPQLPFEVAVFPPRLYSRLRLTVVSYALPALIAVGLVRHRARPTRSRLLRAVRNRVALRLLAVAARMQPANGGYEEATPLTAFVVMCLHAAGYATHEIVLRGLRFLRGAVRKDGSWPIDTNLSTWVTTLSVRALAECPDSVMTGLPQDAIRSWLLAQQSGTTHPLTFGAPGGWAWTDLPGGMPDADDTAGTLLALRRLGPIDERTRRAATLGLNWLLDVQNSDGGIPTFSRGWGRLPFDQSCPDISAHALQAFAEWQQDTDKRTARRLQRAMRALLRYLTAAQHPNGAWIPLWFGNQGARGEQNPVYGTARVVRALQAAREVGTPVPDTLIARGLTCLAQAQNEDGGWGGAAGVPSTAEETGLALSALAAASDRDIVERGVAWLDRATGYGNRTQPVPIGLYFARLWYSEELYPVVFAIEGLARVRQSG